MRSINFTFINNGSPFVFRTDKMTRHPHKQKGATMLQVHAILTQEAKARGENVELLDATGTALTEEQIAHCARTGKLPPLENAA